MMMTTMMTTIKMMIMTRRVRAVLWECLGCLWATGKTYCIIGLITVFDAILTGGQSGQKLQCLSGNPIANNFFQN